MTRYETLLNVLDAIRAEAPSKYKAYHGTSSEDIDNARALSFVHLYLKAKLGLLSFSDRIGQVTDGSGDGGVDGYHIDHEAKQLYLLQAKFRTNEKNFEQKEITADELSKMEISRILEGNENDESGTPYNGKIKGLQREFSKLKGKYKCRVIILANIISYNSRTIKRLVEDNEFEVFSYVRTYKELVFPVCAGTYFDPDEITLEIQTEAGSKGDFYQYIKTSHGEHSVRLAFVPAVEIAKNVSRYKNALLKYNPRNFLSFDQNPVNADIRTSLLAEENNDFALLNNGISIVAESDEYQDRTGVKGIGKLTIKKPQIINGGQTAYATCKLFEEGKSAQLKSKAVLIKVITPAEGASLDISLVEGVSSANNKQTRILEADRRSNAKELLALEQYAFENYCLFFERKRGQFWEGVNQKFIKKTQVINRVLLVRSYYAFCGKASRARTSQEIIFEEELFESILKQANLAAILYAYFCRDRIKAAKKYPGAVYAILASAGSVIDKKRISQSNTEKLLDQIEKILDEWPKFMIAMAKRKKNQKYLSGSVLSDTYFKGDTVDHDIKDYFTASRIKMEYA